MDISDLLGKSVNLYDAQGRAIALRRKNEGSGSTNPDPEWPALVDPLTPLSTQPVSGVEVGSLVFSDEFSGSALDLDKWIPWYPDTEFWNATQPGGHKTNTDEPQGYDETGISFITEGSEKFMRFTLHESNHAVPELDFTSGMVCSYPSFNFTYGYFEARMRMPEITGAWTAFWADPTDMIWPPEIDVIENQGKESFGFIASHTLHYQDDGHQILASDSSTAPNPIGGLWYTWGCLWEPGRLRWYRDGVLTKDLVSEFVPDNDFYLICNLAGDRNNPAVAANAPFHTDVSHIRAWSLAD